MRKNQFDEERKRLLVEWYKKHKRWPTVEECNADDELPTYSKILTSVGSKSSWDRLLPLASAEEMTENEEESAGSKEDLVESSEASAESEEESTEKREIPLSLAEQAAINDLARSLVGEPEEPKKPETPEVPEVAPETPKAAPKDLTVKIRITNGGEEVFSNSVVVSAVESIVELNIDL